MDARTRDLRRDPAGWARELEIPREAIDLYLESDVIDLHLDSFIWTRVFGYDLHQRHGKGIFGDAFYSQSDIPRVLSGGLTGATWVISTNPVLPSALRKQLFLRNLPWLVATLDRHPDVEVVRTAAEYGRARENGKHGAFVGVQGGNCLDRSLDDLDLIPSLQVLRITLVHLTNSKLGTTSSPASKLGRRDGLTDFGRDYVRRLNEKKIFVDLAHIGRKAFFDVLEVHDRSQPLIVTHTGVEGVYPHWRNLTDAQLRAVADTGGTVGVMYQKGFLGKRGVTCRTVVDHLEHIVNTVGEDHASLGSDWDGAIDPPADLATPEMLPNVVHEMLRRSWSASRIRKILGGNFLRAVQTLRG
jgi:membrane dipeptidase